MNRLKSLALPLLATLLVPAAAEAHSGLYLQLGLGFGSFSGTSIVTTEDPNQLGDIPWDDDKGCCPGVGLATQFRVGFSLFGFGGPEFVLIGDGFDSFEGGAGFVGGGIRVFPIKLLSLTGLDSDGFPIDIGLGVNLGYTMLGKDFAYTGSYWDFDIDIQYKLASFMSIGARFDVAIPAYGDFAFTDYKNDRGRCLDDGGNQVLDQPVNTKDASSCAGSGPSTTFMSPQVIITFHFDLFES